MAKDINLNSSEWCDLVFEGKNKSYGAYKMRGTSSKRHVLAFIIIILFVVFVAFLPFLIKTVQSVVKGNEQITTVTELSKLEQEIPEDIKVYKEQAPPPPLIKNTIKFTPPVITDDALVNEADEMKSQADLNESKTAISVADITTGSDDKNAIDIADLQDNKVVAEEKPFYAVEQDPTFPGGEAEFNKFINENLRYPTSAAELGIEGRVLIRFVVSKTGEVTNIELIRGIDPSCDKEALRVVKLMPKWIPGRQNGRNVPVYFTLPIVYKMQNRE